MRPRLFAVFSSAWVIPGVIGPAASTGIAGGLGWRAVFLALLPFVAVAAYLTIPVLSRPDEAAAERAAGPSRVRSALALTLGAGGVLAAVGGAPLVIAIPLVALALPIAVRAFLLLVPTGTVRLAPGMPAAVAVRGLLTFAFFGTDAFVSLTFQDVRDQPTWVAGLALTAATLAWTSAAWVQERVVVRVGPRRLVATGFALLAAGIAGMHVALQSLPIPLCILAWGVAGGGIGLCYSVLSMTVLGLAEPGREGEASAAIQLTDVLGVALGAGCGGAFVALGDGRGWQTSSALELAMAVTLAVALAGVAAARRLPTQLPT
jgi:MFS family permease